MGKQKVGVLVMSYGTPESMEQVVDYYTHIRRGRPPEPEQLQDLIDRYEAIGGLFPLRENTNRQVSELERVLNERGDPNVEYVCYQGLKHASPYIEDGVNQMADDGIIQAVGIVLAPHYSTMSVGSYNERAQQTANERQLNMSFVDSYYLHPKLIQALVERVEKQLSTFDIGKEDVHVIYTAHSLPERIKQMNDPYPEQLLETSRAISEQANVSNWQFAWQSAGQTPEPWLGPDILDVLREVAEQGRTKHVLICPIGFVSDHLEVLYDIDIECQQVAKEVGLKLKRTASLNTDPLYMETLADSVLKELQL